MNKEKMSRGLLTIDIIIFLATLLCVANFFVSHGDGNMSVTGTRGFMFFTTDSNVLAGISALIMAVLRIRKKSIPKWATVFKLISTVTVTLTLMVVMCFLGPIAGYGQMLAGTNFYMHLVGPLAAIFTCLLEGDQQITRKESLTGLIPVIIYGLVYMTMVIIVKKWYDFYHFNLGGLWPLTFLVIVVVSTAFCLLLGKGHNGCVAWLAKLEAEQQS